jgi:hypothetical protein
MVTIRQKPNKQIAKKKTISPKLKKYKKRERGKKKAFSLLFCDQIDAIEKKKNHRTLSAKGRLVYFEIIQEKIRKKKKKKSLMLSL